MPKVIYDEQSFPREIAFCTLPICSSYRAIDHSIFLTKANKNRRDLWTIPQQSSKSSSVAFLELWDFGNGIIPVFLAPVTCILFGFRCIGKICSMADI